MPPVALSAWTWISLAYFGWRTDDVNPWDRGREDAEVAHQLDPSNYLALGAIAALMTYERRPREGAEYGRRMTELNPYAPLGFLMLGQNLDKTGEHEHAIAELIHAWRLGRHDPLRIAIANDLAYSHYMARSYEATLAWGRESLRASRGYLQPHLAVAAACGQLGLAEQAKPHIDAVLEIRPGFSSARSRLVYDDEADRDHFVSGLLKAGLPA